MKTLILYATKYGTTEKCAKILSELLKGEVDLINLNKVKHVDLSQYNRVIIGGSVYMGKIHKEIAEFCSNHAGALKDIKLGLFICCMREGEVAETELNEAFPEELLTRASAKDYFGGEFVLKKMGFMDRLIVKKVSKIDNDVSNLSSEKIYRFAQALS